MSIGLSSEVERVDLGDKRLDRRLCQVIQELGESPALSIPSATQGRTEMEAAYRLFDNPKVTPQKILAPHIEATRQRISEREFVLLVQDTSELDLTRPRQQVDGAGPMDHESRRGAFFHPLLAFDGVGIPLALSGKRSGLGIHSTAIWATRSVAENAPTHRSKKKKAFRWIEGIRQASDVARSCPAMACVCVGDSEADIYESFIEPREFVNSDASHGELHLIISSQAAACHPRNWRLVRFASHWAFLIPKQC